SVDVSVNPTGLPTTAGEGAKVKLAVGGPVSVTDRVVHASLPSPSVTVRVTSCSPRVVKTCAACAVVASAAPSPSKSQARVAMGPSGSVEVSVRTTSSSTTAGEGVSVKLAVGG